MKITKISQEIYDNIFLNIENNLREMGHGDVTVNKNEEFKSNFSRLVNEIR